jgi:Tfp pilus assembly protein PilV
MKLKRSTSLRAHPSCAYTLPEILISVVLLSMVTLALFSAFTFGIEVIQSTRENLRATQILTRKTEAIRLLTWQEAANPSYVPRTFSDWYEPPSGTNTQGLGTEYQGFVSVTSPPQGVPQDYANNMRVVTVTLYWTNIIHGSTAPPIVRTRSMQTFVARYGMQNSIYQ